MLLPQSPALRLKAQEACTGWRLCIVIYVAFGSCRRSFDRRERSEPYLRAAGVSLLCLFAVGGNVSEESGEGASEES